jgi:hypothetical protein
MQESTSQHPQTIKYRKEILSQNQDQKRQRERAPDCCALRAAARRGARFGLQVCAPTFADESRTTSQLLQIHHSPAGASSSRTIHAQRVSRSSPSLGACFRAYCRRFDGFRTVSACFRAVRARIARCRALASRRFRPGFALVSLWSALVAGGSGLFAACSLVVRTSSLVVRWLSAASS